MLLEQLSTFNILPRFQRGRGRFHVAFLLPVSFLLPHHNQLSCPVALLFMAVNILHVAAKQAGRGK